MFEYQVRNEFTIAHTKTHQVALNIWSGMMEGKASELAARMTSMDNATKNASAIIGLLAIQYNRGMITLLFCRGRILVVAVVDQKKRQLRISWV